MSKDKEKGKGTSIKGLLLISFLMTVTLSVVALLVILIVKPETAQVIKEMNISIGSEKEYYSKPIEFVAEIQKEDEQRKYVNAEITLTVDKKKKIKQFEEEEIKLMDLYIRYFSEKSEEELKTNEGQEKVKEELKEKIEKEMGEEIKGIYLTKWLFQ